MKKMEIKFIAMICVLLSTFNCMAQKNDAKKIETVITAFSKAGDVNDAEKLSTYLDDNFRVVMNRLFGSKDVSIMSKSVYLDKIKSKEFGGDKRKLTIENIIVNETSASAKVTFKGEKMTFVSIMALIKNDTGDWKLINEIPIVK